MEEMKDRFFQVTFVGSVTFIGLVLWSNKAHLKFGEVPDYFVGIGFILGALGLNTWRKQLRGTHDFELARRALSSLYRIRDAIHDVRVPFMETSEADDPSEAAPNEPWQFSAYRNRWKPLTGARRDLDVALLEAEAVWGDLLKEEHQALRKHIHSLNLATSYYLESLTGGVLRELFDKEQREILYHHGVENPYSEELSRIIRNFENKLRPKLDHS